MSSTTKTVLLILAMLIIVSVLLNLNADFEMRR